MNAPFSRYYFLLLLGLVVFMIAPLSVILSQYWPKHADYVFYAMALKHFSAQLWAGDAFPRWLDEVNVGFGSPVFLFYGPLPFYVGSLWGWLSQWDPNGYFRLQLSMATALLVSGFSARAWLRHYFPEDTACKGALLYVCFPYTLVPLYLIPSSSQLWSLALFPLLLSGAYKLTQTPLCAVLKLALVYALLSLAHLPSLIVFAWIPVCYAAFCAPAGKRVRALLLAGGSGFLGACMAAFYLLPAFLNKAYINVGHYTEPQFNYAMNFSHGYTLIGIGLILLPLAVLFFGMPKDKRKSLNTPQALFWQMVMIILVFMTTIFSKPLWDAIPMLQYLSFPFRFFLAAVPGAVFLALLWNSDSRHKNLHFLLALAICVMSPQVALNIHFTKDDASTKRVIEEQSIIFSEYYTRWMVEANVLPTELASLAMREPVQLSAALLHMPDAVVSEGKAKLSDVIRTRNGFSFKADIGTAEARISLRRFYFPDWQTNAGQVEPHKALLSVVLPQGTHQVELQFAGFQGQGMGHAISLAAWLIFLALALAVAIDRNRGARPY